MLPEKLQPGDRIAVISPSHAIYNDVDDMLEEGIRFLENSGFTVVPAKHCCSKDAGYAATPQQKAEDINAAFADPSIKAILCSQGGNTANACLPFLDWEIIRGNPKIICGISDITVLLNAIHGKTGMITFHGPDLIWGLGRPEYGFNREQFLKILTGGKSGIMDNPFDTTCLRAGKAAGTLIGGHMRCLLKLAGTEYLPDLQEAILFLEEISTHTAQLDSILRQYEQMGVFDRISGLIIGHLEDIRDPHNRLENLLEEIFCRYDFPVLKVKNFGHNCPNTVLPIGCRVRMDGASGTITILDDYLS